MHFRPPASEPKPRRSNGEALRRAGALVAMILLCAPHATAEPRQAIDLEPVTPYFAMNEIRRATVSVLAYTYGYRFDSWVTYFGGGIGFFTFQTRAGVSWLPGDLDQSGPLVRLEVRPLVMFGNCWEPMVVGSLGVGYRWPLERGDPGQPGTALYLLPAFTGGVGFVHHDCGRPTQGPLDATGLLGGTLSGGFDW